MFAIREPKFSPSTKNRSPLRNNREDVNAPFDMSTIVCNEFQHAMANIMPFEKSYDAIDKSHAQRTFYGSKRSATFDFTCLASRQHLIDSFKRRPEDWSYQDTLLLKAFISFCGRVQESVGTPYFHLTDLTRQDFLRFMRWHATQPSWEPFFEKYLTWKELEQAIVVLKQRESSMSSASQQRSVAL